MCISYKDVKWKIIVDYLVFKNSLTCIFQFWRPPLASKCAPLLKDAEFAIQDGPARSISAGDLRGQ